MRSTTLGRDNGLIAEHKNFESDTELHIEIKRAINRFSRSKQHCVARLQPGPTKTCGASTIAVFEAQRCGSDKPEKQETHVAIALGVCISRMPHLVVGLWVFKLCSLPRDCDGVPAHADDINTLTNSTPQS